MPVTFKGDSEYHEEYKWQSSPKCATFTPTVQQAAPIAGLSSPQASQAQGFMDEPAILRKKKPIPFVTTSTTKMFDEDIVVPDDYMLLGSQEKFTRNVPYKDYLTKNHARVLGTTYVAPTKPFDFEQLQPSPSKPLVKIDFDTGAPKRKEQIISEPAPVVAPKQPPVQVPKQPPVQAPKQPPVEVVGKAIPLNLSKTRVIGKKPPPVSPGSDNTDDIGPWRAFKSIEAPKTQTTVPTKSYREPYKAAAVERDTRPRASDQGAKISQKQDPNVNNTYAMRYRAGIAPQRVSAKRKSEYAYKYDWKKPVDSTPLLAAEQVVHNSNPQVGPYKFATPKKSEYSKEFKAWKYKPVVSQDDSINAARNLRRSIKGSKLRRTQSEMDLTPDRRPAAGSPSRVYHDNARLTQSLNPQKPFFPHRRTVSWATEYKSNFQPFSKFKYDQGAWQGAAPPHIRQQMNYEHGGQTADGQVADGQAAAGNWTVEVKELREKAEEYRKRSNGTHFSRVHVAQLLSDNSKLWDVVSVSSDLSALDLEQSHASNSPPQEKRKSSKKSPRQRTQSAQAALRFTGKKMINESVQTGEVQRSGGRKRLAWSSDGGRSTSPSDSVRSIRSSSSQTVTVSEDSYRPRRQRSPVKEANKPLTAQVAPVSERSSETSESTIDGRTQTPELANASVVHRHHLDVTTPNRHGMLLSSPPHKHKSSGHQTEPLPQTRKNLERKGGRGTGDHQKNISHGTLNVCVPKQSNKSQHLLSPTYGKPTPDTHPLLDEDVPGPVDMILETRYVQSPQPKAKRIPSLFEGAGMTYKVPNPPAKPDDLWNNMARTREDDECSEASQFSTSMMSVISSTSSLASEVLDRAAKRQKHFWGQQAKA